jgi:hypothetical protein
MKIEVTRVDHHYIMAHGSREKVRTSTYREAVQQMMQTIGDNEEDVAAWWECFGDLYEDSGLSYTSFMHTFEEMKQERVWRTPCRILCNRYAESAWQRSITQNSRWCHCPWCKHNSHLH